jgi:Big-like domain-containing protein
MGTNQKARRRVFATVMLIGLLAVVPVAFAGKGGNGGGGGGGGGGTHGGGGTGGSTSSSCTPAAPGVTVQNNWSWGTTGSWGLPGQQLGFQVQVTNYDVGCSAASFAVSVSAPNGFSVSVPSNTMTLNSASSAYVSFDVTSPAVVADGDYPLTVTVARLGDASSAASAVTYYKVYSADTSAPTLFWNSPGDGATVSGNSYTVTVSSSDDHAVKNIDLYIDGAYVTTTACDDITYICQLTYNWSLNRLSGQHTVTFRSHDWLGNVGSLAATFTVG